MKGKCPDCKWNMQGKHSMHCFHPKAIIYKSILNEACLKCGRKKGVDEGGCGVCIGRGAYTYPNIYDTCDINSFEKGVMSKEEIIKNKIKEKAGKFIPYFER